jgi:hypothetical protein
MDSNSNMNEYYIKISTLFNNFFGLYSPLIDCFNNKIILFTNGLYDIANEWDYILNCIINKRRFIYDELCMIYENSIQLIGLKENFHFSLIQMSNIQNSILPFIYDIKLKKPEFNNDETMISIDELYQKSVEEYNKVQEKRKFDFGFDLSNNKEDIYSNKVSCTDIIKWTDPLYILYGTQMKRNAFHIWKNNTNVFLKNQKYKDNLMKTTNSSPLNYLKAVIGNENITISSLQPVSEPMIDSNIEPNIVLRMERIIDSNIKNLTFSIKDLASALENNRDYITYFNNLQRGQFKLVHIKNEVDLPFKIYLKNILDMCNKRNISIFFSLFWGIPENNKFNYHVSARLQNLKHPNACYFEFNVKHELCHEIISTFDYIQCIKKHSDSNGNIIQGHSHFITNWVNQKADEIDKWVRNPSVKPAKIDKKNYRNIIPTFQRV